MAILVLKPRTFVGGYRLLKGDFAPIFRVDAIKVRMRFECVGRLVNVVQLLSACLCVMARPTCTSQLCNTQYQHFHAH